MKKAGVPQFDYDSFKQVYDTLPQLQKLVKFDPEGVTINSSSMDQVPQSDRDNTDSVEKMAKRAVDLDGL